MTVVTQQAKTWTWSPAVLALAKKLQVEPYLDLLMEATVELFPTAREIRVMAEKDHEIAGLEWIAFEVELPGFDLPAYRDMTRQWIRALYRVCPSPLVHAFVQSLIPVVE